MVVCSAATRIAVTVYLRRSGVFAPVELKIGANTIVVKSNLGCLPRGRSGATAATAAHSNSLICPGPVKQQF